MLWGWGKLLTEELPLQVDVQGPRKADFLNLEGRFALGDLLEQLADDHQVRLVLRQPNEARGVDTEPETVSSRITIRKGADAAERAYVRRGLRHCLWADDHDGKQVFAELAPALCAALGIKIESTPPLPAAPKFPMVCRNMRLAPFLNDVARRLNVRLTLSRSDPMAQGGREIELDETVGGANGLLELTVNQPDGRGYINMFARVQPKSCLCARLFTNNSRFLAPPGIDAKSAGPMYHKAATRLERGTVARLAVVGSGCALSVGGEWVLVNKLHRSLTNGGFRAQVKTKWVKVGKVRFAPL